MNYDYFIGIDISKDTLDVCLIERKFSEAEKFFQTKNAASGMKELFSWLKQVQGYSIQGSIFCMEYTGVYNYHALEALLLKGAHVWVENPMQIKKSGGLQRGKNDKTDAKRIASYALRNEDQVRLWLPTRQVVERIKELANLRNNLLEIKVKLENPIKEYRQFGDAKIASLMEKRVANSLSAIDADIEKIEKDIKEIIKDDDQLKQLFGLITSVVGIGFVTAVNLIIHTNEFKLFLSARQLACYCGVAPFEHSSGKSVRGKTRVSHLANKKLKSNLHMGALSAIRVDSDLKKYYQRKVAEGKNKMSILNAVRNKLVHRIFAVVARKEPYLKNYSEKCLIMS